MTGISFLRLRRMAPAHVQEDLGLLSERLRQKMKRGKIKKRHKNHWDILKLLVALGVASKEVWPSQARLGEVLGLSRQKVNKHVKALAAEGYLKIKHRRIFENGKWKKSLSNIYSAGPELSALLADLRAAKDRKEPVRTVTSPTSTAAVTTPAPAIGPEDSSVWAEKANREKLIKAGRIICERTITGIWEDRWGEK